ncbi:MAG: hypothetical protein M5R36_21705 [Deltaproteobacteria bacterium]|nr:hypothetical protein [Deltaproteobacteria bacterium]
MDKITAMAHRATGVKPDVRFWKDRKAGLTIISVRKGGEPSPPPQVENSPTDDWPFLYLKERGLPSIYLKAMLVMGVWIAGLFALLYVFDRRTDRGTSAPRTLVKGAFIFMGVAFLLLETKSVIQFALLFGTTWVNNSLVFLAILLLILAANWTAVLLKDRRVLIPVFVLLIASSLLPLAYPLGRLLEIDSRLVRFAAASLLTFSPIFFANLVFSLAFRDQNAAERLFGWNLLGATIGGTLEYVSMALGYNALAIIVAICYLLVFACLMLARRIDPERAGLVPRS